MIWTLIHLLLWPQALCSHLWPECRGTSHWATRKPSDTPLTRPTKPAVTHTPQMGQARESPCRRPSHSVALRLTLGNSVSGPCENETRWHFQQVREGQWKGRNGCYTTAPVRNSTALFVQVSDFIRLCHSVNIVYGPILCLWIAHSQRLFLHPFINSTTHRTEFVKQK